MERSQSSTNIASRQFLHHCASISGPHIGSRQLDNEAPAEDRIMRRCSTFLTGGYAAEGQLSLLALLQHSIYSHSPQTSVHPNEKGSMQLPALHAAHYVVRLSLLSLLHLVTPAEEAATGLCSPLGSPLSPSPSFQHHLPSPLGRSASTLASLRPQLLSWELDCSTRSQEQLVRAGAVMRLVAWCVGVLHGAGCLLVWLRLCCVCVAFAWYGLLVICAD